MRSTGRSESGVVSLFLVIFSALLMTIITVAFIRIMIQDQEQATTNDLSKSALDSAYAGVEDAKRAILQYESECGTLDAAADPGCNTIVNAFKKCDSLQQLKVSGKEGDSEVKVQQNPSDDNDPDLKLAQAYTCVTIALDTPDYKGALTSSTSRLIHLKPSTSDSDKVNAITVSWYSLQDLQSGISSASSNGSGGKVNLNADPQLPLPKLDDPTNGWPKNRPPLLRVQLLQFDKTGFHLSDFGKNNNDAALFLYPSNFGTPVLPSLLSFANDFRLSQSSPTLQPVTCDDTFSTSGGKGSYACDVALSLPDLGGTSDNTNRDAYLLVSEIYSSNTNFSVTMNNFDPSSQKLSDPIDFHAVQPDVDSTGRANDLFRRVDSRIDLEASSIPNAQAAVDISGSLCKNFVVTDDAHDFVPGTCKE